MMTFTNIVESLDLKMTKNDIDHWKNIFSFFHISNYVFF